MKKKPDHIFTFYTPEVDCAFDCQTIINCDRGELVNMNTWNTAMKIVFRQKNIGRKNFPRQRGLLIRP